LIHSFYFYCFIKRLTNQFDWGVPLAVDWFSQSLQMKPFYMQFLWTIAKHMVSLKSKRRFLMETSKLRIRLSRACSSPCHSMVDFRIMLVMQESLI
jgi:hypothetical protein